jgi:enamine deaminase RidA (YjgF/YER057c/UK114 family)
MPKEFFNPTTLPPPVGYSHAVKVDGGLVYVAGQLSSDSSGKLVGEGDFEAQVEQVFKNLGLVLEAAGAKMRDIVKMNIYVVAEVSQDDVPKLRAIRDRYVDTAKPPASTLVFVSRLARPGWLVEIEAVAYIDGFPWNLRRS